VVASYDHGIGAQLPGHFYRHGTPYPISPCLVTAAGYHTSVARAANNQRDVLQGAVAQTLYTYKKAVQIHVRNVFFHDKKINKKLAYKLTIKDEDSKTIIHLWLFIV
jgi:hypothetical protein